MLKTFCKSPLWEAARTLALTAQGLLPAETVIQNVRLVNVCTGEIIPGQDIAVAQGRIALVGDAAHCIGPRTQVLRGEGRYACPGFLDGHIHIESSMLSVGEYARAVLPHGTVGVYIDPHEICNVLGLEGVRCMLRDAARAPLKTMVTIPSCVPAVPGFEDTGGSIGPQEVEEAMSWPQVVGLGEMMNFPGVLAGAAQPFEEMAAVLRAGGTVTGHYSLPETGKGLNGYIAAGIRCCHESTRAEDAVEKMRRGMYAQIREGSAWHDLREVIQAVTRGGVDSRFACLVSDDAHPHTLLSQGHMDHILRRAIQEGADPVTAIQMATINTAQCFGMEADLGSLSPSRCADLLLLENLEQVSVSLVMIDGQVVAEEGRCLAPMAPYTYPDWARRSMHVGGVDAPGRDREQLEPEDFVLRRPALPPEESQDGAAPTRVLTRVMEIIPERVGNRERLIPLPVISGQVEADPGQDVLKAVVFERHRATGTAGFGFVKGFGIREGAMASTVAHDAHNLLVVGANDRDMALAANTLLQSGGGMCVVQGGRLLGHLPLPIAGLMHPGTAGEVSGLVEKLEKSWKAIGCSIHAPFMTMALLSLACLPELRLTNRGLVDCRTFQKAELFVDSGENPSPH